MHEYVCNLGHIHRDISHYYVKIPFRSNFLYHLKRIPAKHLSHYYYPHLSYLRIIRNLGTVFNVRV